MSKNQKEARLPKRSFRKRTFPPAADTSGFSKGAVIFSSQSGSATESPSMQATDSCWASSKARMRAKIGPTPSVFHSSTTTFSRPSRSAVFRAAPAVWSAQLCHDDDLFRRNRLARQRREAFDYAGLFVMGDDEDGTEHYLIRSNSRVALSIFSASYGTPFRE